MLGEDRLREYVENDDIYQKFINGILRANDMSDFDKFCVQHCWDIEKLLNERSEWIELLGKFKNQQREFIKYLEEPIKLIKQGNPTNISEYTSAKLDILEEILKKYKEIVN